MGSTRNQNKNLVDLEELQKDEACNTIYNKYYLIIIHFVTFYKRYNKIGYDTMRFI